MGQIAFHWPSLVSYAAEDYIASGSTAEAQRFISTWPQSNDPFMLGLLCGPAGSGKTHLAHIWASRMKAHFLPAGSLGALTSEQLWQQAPAGVMEDIETADEKALFHLIRHSETHRIPLLLTAKYVAGELPFTLPDLRSRLMAAPAAIIGSPDEEALQLFFAKQFADRQWRVNDRLIPYILARMERSFTAAQSLVAKMEQILQETNEEVSIFRIKSLL